MTPQQVNSICERHGIPAEYHAHFRLFAIDGRIISRKFVRLTRRSFKFKTCLEEVLDVLSEPYKRFFEPARFESLTLEQP